MELKNSSVGKIGQFYTGPRQFLHTDIKLGEMALCIERDDSVATKPNVWLFGGIEEMIDYLSAAAFDGHLDKEVVDILLHSIDKAKETIKTPVSAIERLSNLVGVEPLILASLAKLAQVSISAPIDGIKEFSTGKATFLTKTKFDRELNH